MYLNLKRVKSKVRAEANQIDEQLIDDLEKGADRIEFVEDGDTIQMAVNDGGDTEFLSEEENTAPESDSDTENSENENSRADPDSADEAAETDVEMSEESDISPPPSEQATPVKAKRKRQDKAGGGRKLSVEDRLESMSSAILAMKEMLSKNGMADTKGAASLNRGKGVEHKKVSLTQLI